MGYSLANEILCKLCMQRISLKINTARDRDTAQHLHIVFSSSSAHITHRFQSNKAVQNKTATSLAKDFLHVFTNFQLIPILLISYHCPKNLMQKLSDLHIWNCFSALSRNIFLLSLHTALPLAAMLPTKYSWLAQRCQKNKKGSWTRITIYLNY